MDDLTMKILKLVITIAIALITRYAVPYFKELLSTAKMAKVITYVTTAVKAAEKLFTESGSGKEKKAYVVKFIQEVLTKLHITMTEEEIDTLIESAVEDLDIAKKENK